MFNSFGSNSIKLTYRRIQADTTLHSIYVTVSARTNNHQEPLLQKLKKKHNHQLDIAKCNHVFKFDLKFKNMIVGTN
jgi:hypothetical protein